MSPRATVLIPTWDAADTLGPALASATAQTERDLEILVVSDGAHPATLEIADAAAATDARIHVLRLPKSPARGEANRHRGVLEASAEIVVYLADDDLLLPRHVENLLNAFENLDFAQSWNGYIDAHSVLRLLPADLGDPAWRTWHLADPPHNRVSITGTAHTVAAYRRLPHGWIVPEPGMAADLTLWRQFFALPDLRATTLPEMTTLQFPGAERKLLTAEGFRALRAEWEDFFHSPDVHERLQKLAAEAVRRELLELSAFAYHHLIDIPILVEQRDAALRALEEHERPGS